MPDVRVNRVTTDVSVTDVSALLTPKVLDKIVAATLERLAQERHRQRGAQRDRALESARHRKSRPS
jgi:4-hydroxy-L-threonine phosphate dehydrogenase PdxA